MKKNMQISLLRPQQWYKNLLVFVPIIFSLNLLDIELFFLSLQGFILLCLSSSALYIFNDLIDYEKDKIHPVKKYRPIVSGKISKQTAFLIAIVFLAISLICSIILNHIFFLMNLFLIISTIIYTIRGKNIVVLDVSLISINYVFRAVAGGYLLTLDISNWLIVGIFFFALLLSFSKRFNELQFLKTNSEKHRKSLKRYSIQSLRWSIYFSSAFVIITYSAYAISGSESIEDWRLVLTIPLAILIIWIYSQRILSGNFSSKEFHQMLVNSKSLLFLISSFVISIVILIYFIPTDFFKL
mgnify:FL=1